MNLELRWAVKPGTNTDPPRLQYRTATGQFFFNGKTEIKWSEWKDVPKVVVP